MEGKRRLQIKDIVQTFRGKVVNAKLLKEYCDRHQFELVTEGEFQDFLFQQEHDERVQKCLPAILAELSKFQQPGEWIGDDEREKINEQNEIIAVNICAILEDNGVLYNEIEILTKNIGNALQAIMEGAGRRASNMCAATFTHITKAKFDDPLTVKKLADYHRTEIEKIKK